MDISEAGRTDASNLCSPIGLALHINSYVLLRIYGQRSSTCFKLVVNMKENGFVI